jgi:hypothetical protein
MHRRTLVVLTLAACAALPAPARAAFFPAELVDGPSPDVTAVGDLDVSRDGNGALTYLKRDGGADHVFLSVLNGGAFGPGGRVDAGLAPAASQPVVAASDAGRLAVAWVTDGSLLTAVRPRGGQGLTPPVVVAQGGVSNPSVDMSINGATYLSYTQNGDVRVARAERDSPQFTVLPAPVDVDPAREAGTGADRASEVAISADGTGLVVWGEDGADGRGHVFARRLFEQRLSVAPQDLTLADVEGRTAAGADRPDVDIEDDSSYAQVVFRQTLAGGGARTIARRLVGSAFEAPVPVDGGAASTGGRVDLTGRGEGLVAADGAQGEVIGSTVFNNALSFAGGFGFGAAGVRARATPAVGENEDGAVAWMSGTAADASVRAKYVDGVEKPAVSEEAVLSTGPVDPDAGFAAAPTRVGDALVAFVQRTGDARAIVVAAHDRPPTRPVGSTSERPRKPAPLRWQPSLDLLGPPTYTVTVDGRVLGQTQATELAPPPGALSEGEHTWQVTATDRRGQAQTSRTRRLRVDATPPTLTARFSRRQRVLTIVPRAGDPSGAAPSGLSRVVVDLGNGRRTTARGRLTYRYPRRGTYTVVVTATDRAGNATEVRRRITI